MAVKVNGNRGLNFTGTFDISEIEANAKKALTLIGTLQKQTNAATNAGKVDDSFRKEQVAMQKALADSRLAMQRLKEEQAAQRVELEKSRAVAAEFRAENERLKVTEKNLNLEYKQGKIALQEYTLEQRKITDAQREATRLQREAERNIREQTRLQKEQEKQAERNRKQLEKESSEYYKLTQALGKVRKEAKDVQAEMFRLEREGLKASDAYRQLETRSKALTSQTQLLDRGVKQIDASLGLHQRNVGNYGSALSNISPIFAGIERQLGNFGTSLDDLASNKDPFKALGNSVMAFGRATAAFLLTPVGAIIGTLAALFALISSNKKTIVEFDAGLRGVQKTTNMADEELFKFGDAVIALSNNLKSVSSKELLEYAQVAGQLGVKGSANILKFSETLARLQTASDISGEQGASEIARLLTLTDGGVENVQAFGDEIVNLGNNFAATEKEILANAERIAQNTGLYKIGRQEVLAYATATKAVGVEAELVGSTFGRTLGTIEKALRTGNGAEAFAAVTGKSVEELKKAFKQDASGVFNEFIAGLNKVNKTGGSVNAVLERVNITAIRDQAVLASLATNGYDVLNDAMDKVRTSGGALGNEFETANKKLENVGKRIGISWDNLVLSIENGQGVFAKVGSYIGNEFADFLVSTKGVIDDISVGFDVFGQYLDEFNAKAEESGKMNMQYADSLSGIKEFFGQISMRAFVFTFTVEIPNALRTAGAYVDVFSNTVARFFGFLQTAGPEIGKYLKDALNPFAEADSTSLDALWNSFKGRVKSQNDFILDDTRRVNEEQKRLFAERYENATDKNIAGEEFARNNQELSPEQKAALKAEEDRLRQEVEAEKKAAQERVAARLAMQKKIDEINAGANRKQLSRDEAEIQAVKDKYTKIRQEIENFYKNPKNKGLRIDASGLGASEQKELENVRANQETEALKASLSEQKQLYEQYEQYKTEYGQAKARERFKGDISEFESYVAYLKSLVPDAADTSVLATRMREMLGPVIAAAEKDAADKTFDANLKNLRRIVDATQTANMRRVELEAQYLRDIQALEKEYAGSQNAEELAARKEALAAQQQLKREANQREAFEETAFFKKAMQDITFMTRDELKARAKELRKILKDPSLSPIERSVAQQGLDQTKGFLDETNQVAENAREIQEYANTAANSFGQMAQAVGGMNPELGEVFGKLSQIAGVAGNAAGAFASFSTGDFIGGITQGVGAITGIISMFDNSQERQRQAEERRKYAQELQIKSIEAATKALERQLALIEDIYGVERLQAYGQALQDINDQIKEQVEALSGKYVLTGDKTNDDLLTKYNKEGKVNLPGIDGYLAKLKDSTYTLQELVEGVAQGNAESVEQLQQLLDKKLLDEGTAKEVEALLGNAERLKETFKQMNEEAAGINFDSATNGLLQLFEQGKLGAQDFAQFFNDQLRQSVFASFKRNVLQQAMQPFYEQLAAAGKSDGKLDEGEVADLQKKAAEIQAATKAQFEEYAKVLDGLDMGEAANSNQDTLTGAIRNQLTEETGGKLAGIMQGQFGLSKQQLAVQEAMQIDMGAMLDVGRQQLGYAIQTAQNTRLNAESSVRIEGKLDEIKTALGSGGGSARDLGLDG